jgi:hypothetical protein
MSSLAAVQADGYYIDPSKFDPKRGKGSANAVTGTRALGARAAKLKSEGILVVRFELPYDSQCAKCGAYISHGVRFNADKRRVGEYHTTPIWEFSMTCSAGCGAKFLIRTNPAAGDYDFLSGVKRRVKDFIPELDDGLGRAGGSLLLAAPPPGAAPAGGAAMRAVERRAEADAASAAAARELAALTEASARRYGAGSGALQAAAVGALRARAAAAALAEGEGSARGLAVPFAARGAAEEVEDRLVAAAALRGREEGGGGGGGGGFAPAAVKAALRAAPLPLGGAAAAPRAAPGAPLAGGARASALPSLALALPAPPAPSALDSIIAAGRKRRADEMGAARDAARSGAAAVAASLRAVSGRAARQGAGPHVALHTGPLAPASGGALAAAPLRRLA